MRDERQSEGFRQDLQGNALNLPGSGDLTGILQDDPHLSGSEFVEISDEFSHVFRHFCLYSLPRRDILCSLFALALVYSR